MKMTGNTPPRKVRSTVASGGGGGGLEEAWLVAAAPVKKSHARAAEWGVTISFGLRGHFNSFVLLLLVLFVVLAVSITTAKDGHGTEMMAPESTLPSPPADDPGADLVALGELVVDDGGGAEEEVLERDARREVPGVDVGDVLVAAVDGVAVVLDEGAGGAAASEPRDVGGVVAVDEVGGALRQRHRALDREDVGVGARERELPVGRRARHHAGHDAPRRLRAPEDVVHEERQRVVARTGSCVRCSAAAGSSYVARRGGGTSGRGARRARAGGCGRAGRWRHHHRVGGGIRGGGQRVDRLGSLYWSRGLLVEDAASERAVRHGEREQQVERRPDGLHRVPGHDTGLDVTGRDR